MLRRNNFLITQEGFTLVELMVSISLILSLLTVFSIFFVSNYQAYLNLQVNTTRMNDLSAGLQRVTRVLRGMNSITDASGSSITGFAYFTPRDTTLSKTRYFYDAASKSIKVGVIPASGTAPNYTYNSASEQISTITTNIDSTPTIFQYLDVTNAAASFTADNYKDIYGIRITFKSIRIGTNIAPFQLQTAVSLRNRKTNL